MIHTLTAAEQARNDADANFYAKQLTLQKAKQYFGIECTDYSYVEAFNSIKRQCWLQDIAKDIQTRIDQTFVHINALKTNPGELEADRQQVLIDEELEKREILENELKFIWHKYDLISLSRKGIPLNAPNWYSYEKMINRPDVDLYFLTSLYPSNFNFVRPTFDKADHELLATLFEAYLSPSELIESYSKLLNVDKNTIALASNNRRFTGFEIWLHHSNPLTEEVQTDANIENIEFDESFVVGYANEKIESFLKSNCFQKIDVWLDINTFEIFAKEHILPFTLNRNIVLPKLINTEHMTLIYFDYSPHSYSINVSQAIKQIQYYVPNLAIRSIYIFNNGHFESIPDVQKEIWTFANKLLIGVNSDFETNKLLFIYDCITDQIERVQYTPSSSYESIVKKFSDTLNFLRIEGFEFENPEDLIKKFEVKSKDASSSKNSMVDQQFHIVKPASFLMIILMFVYTFFALQTEPKFSVFTTFFGLSQSPFAMAIALLLPIIVIVGVITYWTRIREKSTVLTYSSHFVFLLALLAESIVFVELLHHFLIS